MVFVDDFIGTGGSCTEGLRVFRQRLDDRGVGADRVVVGVAALVGFRTGMETVRANEYMDCHVVVAEELGTEDRAFAAGAGIFDGERGARSGRAVVARA